MSGQISFKQLQAKLGTSVELSPDTGRPRLSPNVNDVLFAIELLGGVSQAAQRLNVHTERVIQWIEEHYVPDKQADVLSKLTRVAVSSLQIPSCYYFDETTGQYWPPSGFKARRESEWIDLDHIAEYHLLHP